MSQTDAQAALAAAALIVSGEYGEGITLGERETCTLQMADAFMAWLRGYGRATVVADERLVPNEDFRSPSQAQTERINPNDVTFAAAERERNASAVLAAAHLADRVPRSPGASYAGVHVIAPERCTTPSGKRACQCGQAWPCSQNDAYQRRLRGES